SPFSSGAKEKGQRKIPAVVAVNKLLLVRSKQAGPSPAGKKARGLSAAKSQSRKPPASSVTSKRPSALKMPPPILRTLTGSRSVRSSGLVLISSHRQAFSHPTQRKRSSGVNLVMLPQVPSCVLSNSLPVQGSQSRSVPSQLVLASRSPAWLKPTEVTVFE